MSDDVQPGARTAPAVLRALQDGPLGVEDLVSRTSASARSIDLALILLQQDGQVEQLPDGRYGLRDT